MAGIPKYENGAGFELFSFRKLFLDRYSHVVWRFRTLEQSNEMATTY